MAIEPLAGLAFVAWQQEDEVQVAQYIELVAAFLLENAANGTDETMLVYLHCCKVLHGRRDGRFAAVLQRGYTLLQQRAATIQTDKQRKQYLEMIAAHVDIRRQWREAMRE